KGEQPLSCEERIRPPKMVVATFPHPRPLVLLTQERTQPATDKTIVQLVYQGLRMLEVVEPATQRRIQIGYDAGQTVPTRAPRLLPYPLAQRQQTFPSNPAPSDFEAITQKLKSLPRLPAVSHLGLVGIKLEPVLFHPGSHFIKRGLRFFGRLAQNHKVISVAHHAVTPLSHMAVQRVKINIGQKGADHCPLRRPSYRRPALQFLDNVLTEKQLDQLMHGAVTNPFFNSTPKDLMRYGVEETLQVGIHHMGVAFLDQRIHFPQCLFRAASRPKAVTGLLKLLLKDRFDHQLEGRLHDAVFNRWDSQRAQLPARFGYLYALDRLWSILSGPKRSLKFFQIRFCSHLKPLNALPIHSCGSGIAPDFVPGHLKSLAAVHLVDHAKPFSSFDAVFQ